VTGVDVMADAVSSKFAILQLGYGGHRLHYIRTLVEGCDPAIVPRLLTTREALASREFQIQLGDLVGREALHVAVVGSSQEPARRLVAHALKLSAGTPSLRMIVPDADRLLVWLLLASFRYRRSQLPEMRLLIMRTPEPTLRIGRENLVACAKIASSLMLQCWWPNTLLYFLTDAFGVITARRGYRWMQPIRDPAGRLPQIDRRDARSELGLSPDAYVLGLVGAVGASKHPRLTLDALRDLPSRVVVLVAGRTDGATAEAVEAAQRSPVTTGRVIWIDGYLTETHLGTCVSACDALMLTYELDAPSGMLATAIHAGIPIVAGGSRWVTRVVEHLDAGVTTPLNRQGVVRAVTTLMSCPPRPRYFDAPYQSAGQDFCRALMGA
jgi:glycosyltransferase involved in cell wall biosynthesis